MDCMPKRKPRARKRGSWNWERGMQLRIHKWPEKILKKRCRRVEKVDARIQEMFREMYSLMQVHRGIGLAANQGGLDLCLVVIATEESTFQLANPRVVKKEGRITFTEGCLSFPGLEVDTVRARKVWVQALNEEGEEVEIEAEDVLAVVFQHEIDHVNGIPFFRRAKWRDRIRLYPQLKKIVKETRNELRKSAT
ncbi:MAG: peptide deformylase [Candidatus Omnitrophica bacterium]|nr:peptide deformylase [Candidatus Omnitrophota bacterium]